jgi:hypothetical protein
MKRIIALCNASAGVFILIGTFGCASMDTDVKSMRGPAYGQPPRVAEADLLIIRDPADLARYQYDVVGTYIAEETPEVIMSVSADEMLRVAARKAWKDGADAVVVDEFGSKNVAGGAARTSPIVKIRGIRFRGPLPK